MAAARKIIAQPVRVGMGAAPTTVAAVDELLAGFGSGWGAAETLAVLGVTVGVIVAEPPLGGVYAIPFRRGALFLDGPRRGR